MLVSELADRADVPLATVKYYLREGLLPPGEVVGPRRAEYDEAHLRRLRVLRALREVGGAPVSALQVIVDAIEDDSRPIARGAVRDLRRAQPPAAREDAPRRRARPVRRRRDRRRGLERRPADAAARSRLAAVVQLAARSCSRSTPRSSATTPTSPTSCAGPRSPWSTRPRTARARWRTWSSARRSSGRSSPCSAAWGTSTTTSSGAATAPSDAPLSASARSRGGRSRPRWRG